MRFGKPVLLFLALLLLAAVAVAQSHLSTADLQPLPLSFEPNAGQTTPEFSFVAHGPGMSLMFAPHEVVFANCVSDGEPRCSMQMLRMRFEASKTTQVLGEHLAGRANYYVGANPSLWRVGVPMYQALRYRSIYPGIDAVFHGHDGQVEYDFTVAPRANPDAIALDLSGGVSDIENGELVFRGSGRQFRFKRPEIYQEVNGARSSVAGAYFRRPDGRIGFRIGTYDHERALIIDPVVTYASYIGGNPGTVYGVASDSSGNVILTGETNVTDFPVTTGAFQSTLKGYTDAFVSKLNPTGSQFVYSTYFGGTSNETAYAVAIDASGNAYITGVTGSGDLPTKNAYSTSCPSICNTPFAAKFDPSGALIYSTYLGPSNAVARSIAVDAQGNAYITGNIASADLPLVNAFQSTLPEQVSTSGVSAFVQKLSASGSALLYSTYLGGVGADIGRGIAVDASGSAYVVGQTDGGFPVRNPLQADGSGAFITKFTPDGTDLVYSTVFGGSAKTEADAVAVDSSGAAYITGVTTSPDFPLTANAFKSTCAGSTGASCVTSEAYALVLDPTGTNVRYSTFLAEGTVAGITSDTSGNAFIAGSTDWNDFPLVNPLQTTVATGTSGSDLFVTELNSTGTPLLSTILGGYWTGDTAGGIALNNGTIYVAGTTNSSSNFQTNPDFPLINPMTTTISTQNQSPILAEIAAGNGPALSVSPRIAPSVVLRNVSSSTLIFNSITASSDFQMSGDCGTSLTPGADCIVYLKSTDTAPAGTLTVDSNATSTPAVFTIAKATGVDQNTSPYLLIYPNDYLEFPPTFVGESATRSILVRNIGAGSGTIFLNTTGNFQSTNHCSGGVAAGASCTVDVTFTPTIAGSAGGQLGINSNATTIYMNGWGSSTALLPSATTVSFGTQYVGLPGFSRAILLQNVSNESAAYSGLSVSGGFNANSDCPATIPARGSCHVTLTFTPTTNAFYQGTLTVTGAAPVTITGTGRILSALSLSTFDVEFGYTLLAGPYGTQNVTVTNNSANSVNISAVSTTGDFSQTSNCVGALAAQTSCTITVKFVPTAEGDRYGQLSITHDGLGSPQQALLHGLGENYIRLTPSSIDFGNQAVGTASSWHYLSVGNNSFNQSVTISGVTVSDNEFAIAQNPCPTTLQPLYGCALQFTFTPASPGLHQATVTVTSSNPASTETATLQGIGDGPEMALSSTSLSFGTVELGAAPGSQSLSLSNPGSADLQISGISTSGDFSETNTCPAALPAGSQCSISVSFKPSATGARDGSLSISTNASSSPSTVALSGAGADFQFVAGSSGATSQTVAAGQTATFTLQVSGSTGFSDSVTFACANVPAGYSCSANPPSLTVNGTAQNVTVSVTTPVTVAGMIAPVKLPPLMPTVTLAFSGVLGFLACFTARRKIPLCVCAIVVAVSLLAACGGGGGGRTNNPPPPPVVTPQTHTITVTATSQAGDVKSTTLNLTVN